MAVLNNGSRAPVFFGVRKCLYCGVSFAPKCNAQFFCDSKCKELKSPRAAKFKRKDTRLKCLICGREIPLAEKNSWLYHGKGAPCAKKAYFYKLIEHWLRTTKSERIKKSIEYIMLEEKIQRLFYSRKKTMLKIRNLNGEERRQAVKVIAERIFYKKKITKESQTNGKNPRRRKIARARNRRTPEMP